MDPLLAAIGKLTVEGTEEKRASFERAKRLVEKDLVAMRQELRDRLEELHRADKGATMRHAFHVAKDVISLCEELQLPADVAEDLRVAAIVHDIGKLSVHRQLLNNVTLKELQAVWKRRFKGQKTIPQPDRSLFDLITVDELLRHRSHHHLFRKRYLDKMVSWFRAKDLWQFLDRPLNDYLQNHQFETQRLLSDLGVSPAQVAYASSHHSKYFRNERLKDLPPEAMIIEVADKFNAMIESEGKRPYHDRAKTPFEAFAVIVFELERVLDLDGRMLKQVNPGAYRYGFGSLRALIKLHAPLPVGEELEAELKKAEEVRRRVSVLRGKVAPDHPALQEGYQWLAALELLVQLDKAITKDGGAFFSPPQLARISEQRAALHGALSDFWRSDAGSS